jgi:hypothetical protein
MREYGAAGATADRAGHEFLERDLAGQVKVTRQRRDGFEHWRRTTGKYLDVFALIV